MLPSRIFFDDFMDDLDIPRDKKFDKLMKCDIYEKDNNFVIEMDVPGFKKEDIKMELSNGYLNISAEHHIDDKDEDKKKHYIRRERKVDERCERSFYVGDVDEKSVEAEFKNGTLLITVPKEEKEKNNKKLISIK
ncbi:MAG TPA: Hsp20/alpha crystallin family protein [Bacilli bacterium]|nr:Hsp20/alpha crystallin family protein [Bacilli bacterium]HPZ23519.1 Hsp20/alpha crystallin family protein [Bacilli bacterium]HQC83320.1 Hsp20/alpha crystallin family protein [Bacilli bacterium]